MTSNTPSVEANLYVQLGLQSEALWSKISVDFAGGPRGFTARQEEVVRDQQSVPEGMTDWQYEHLFISEESVAQRATPVEMPSASLEIIPDYLGWTPLPIVSARLKSFLEVEFPKGSQFFPFSYIDSETKQQIWPEFWFWLPTHKLNFRPQEKRSTKQNMRPQVWGALGGLDVTWEMYHNKVFQSFASQLPFWTTSPMFNEAVFRSDVYYRLKEKGISGFKEANSDNYLRQSPEDSVGFIQYAK